MPERVIYVYAVVPAQRELTDPPDGVEDAPIERIEEGSLTAIVSRLDGRRYAAHEVAERTGDVAWLAPRARAHDAVVTWASDSGATVPLPMFSMFRDDAGVKSMLRERAPHLTEALARIGRGREYVVRVYRLDRPLLSQGIAKFSERIARLEEAARAATPGQRYLLERKLETEKREEARRVGADVARVTLEALRAHALETATESLPASRNEPVEGTAVLNAAFLIPADRYDAFRSALTSCIVRYEPLGFRFDFTGPWPPFHFVRERSDGE